MKRKNNASHHLDEVRERILASAKELFVQQGYKKTTIRQIVEKSGVLTGSIYYFYKNKEDIFQALILSLLRQCVHLINERFREETPAFKYAAMCIVELKAVEINELARESYYEGYTSKIIFEQMVKHVTAVSIDMFSTCQLPYDWDDYYARTLLIKGAMRSYVAQFYFVQPVGEAYLGLLLRTALDLFQVPVQEIDAVLSRLRQEKAAVTEIAEKLIRQSVEL